MLKNSIIGVPAVFGRKSFPLSDLNKIKVIDKLEVADSESIFVCTKTL